MSKKSEIKRIIIVGTQRSGTTWLMQVLSQISNFNVYGEVFREIYLKDFRGDPSLMPKMFYLDFVEQKNLKVSVKEYVKEVLDEKNKITVFKVMYDQIRRNRELLTLLSDKHTLTINVQRYDIFELALSKCLARKTGVYHTEIKQKLPMLHVEYKTVYELMLKEKVKEFIFPKLIKLFANNYQHFVYEDLLEDFDTLSNCLAEQVSIATTKLNPEKTKWKKTDKADKYRAISNFESLNNKLRKSIFRRYAK